MRTRLHHRSQSFRFPSVPVPVSPVFRARRRLSISPAHALCGLFLVRSLGYGFICVCTRKRSDVFYFLVAGAPSTPATTATPGPSTYARTADYACVHACLIVHRSLRWCHPRPALPIRAIRVSSAGRRYARDPIRSARVHRKPRCLFCVKMTRVIFDGIPRIYTRLIDVKYTSVLNLDGCGRMCGIESRGRVLVGHIYAQLRAKRLHYASKSLRKSDNTEKFSRYTNKSIVIAVLLSSFCGIYWEVPRFDPVSFRSDRFLEARFIAFRCEINIFPKCFGENIHFPVLHFSSDLHHISLWTNRVDRFFFSWNFENILLDKQV